MCRGKWLRAAAWFAAPLFLVSCGGGEVSPPMLLAREVNYIQCEESKTALALVDQSLADAGVEVFSKSCASDGLVIPAVCGITIHYLRSVEIPRFQEPVARSLGFRAPGEFYSFLPIDCPSQ